MSDQDAATPEALRRQVLALQEAVAALAVAQAEGLNALAELARVLTDQHRGRGNDNSAGFAASRVNRRAAAAARRSLDVAETLLADQRPASDEP